MIEKEMLPCYLTGDEHPYVIKLVRAYAPHTSPQLGTPIQHKSPCNLKDIGREVNYDFGKRV